MKRIIICCDGTWNSPGDTDNGSVIKTNVQKLFECVCNLDGNGIFQIKHYIEGVGTSGSRLRRIIDGATGWGINNNILSAYRFLVWNYVQGDEIYLFGFSRGAYTARSIAGLIRNCGIIRSDDLSLINEAYAHYRNKKDAEWSPDGKKAQEFRKKYSLECTIKFIGVWDTVGALGIPFSALMIYNRNKYKFHDTKLSSSVDYAYQALAIDEHRKSFDATIWQKSPKSADRQTPQVLEQRWFSGVHSNVGGGYASAEVSDFPLKWMIEKAAKTNLAFEPKYIEKHIHPNLSGKLNDSFVFPFNLAGSLRREINFDPIYCNAIDDSVVYRWKNDASYRPENIKHILQMPDKIA